jgi:hypothetical protein
MSLGLLEIESSRYDRCQGGGDGRGYKKKYKNAWGVGLERGGLISETGIMALCIPDPACPF